MTFIAFEGFETSAYDVRELRHPIRTLKRGCRGRHRGRRCLRSRPWVRRIPGREGQARQKESAWSCGVSALTGIGAFRRDPGGRASATSATSTRIPISVARLARTAAERRRVPGIFKRTNRNQIPYWGSSFSAVRRRALPLFRRSNPWCKPGA
ncbi:MAG: hypothetical protein QM784_29175 [Polyangiaceae bacterium]